MDRSLQKAGGLAKVESGGYVEQIRNQIVASVPTQIRLMAVGVVCLFDDRPQQAGLDDEAASVKLAFHLHRHKVSQEEIAQVCMELDLECTFRPTVADIMQGVFRLRRRQAAAALEASMTKPYLVRRAGQIVETSVPKDRLQQFLDQHPGSEIIAAPRDDEDGVIHLQVEEGD